MRFLWKTLKVLVALAIVIPLGMLALAVGFGVLGAVLGIAILALKLAVFALLAYGAFKLLGALFGASRTDPAPAAPAPRALPPRDLHYEAAMRELDEALGERPRRS